MLVLPSRLFLFCLLLALLLHLAAGFLPMPVEPLPAPKTPPASLNLTFAPASPKLPAEPMPSLPAPNAKPASRPTAKADSPKPVSSKPLGSKNLNPPDAAKPPASSQPATNLPTSQGLASRSLAKAGQVASYSNPQLRRLTASSQLTSEEKFYLAAWQAKVESLGRLNYPAEAAKQNLSGKLKLSVLINADGSLEKVQLLETSGYQILDKAAINIVQLAAPFAPLPPALQATSQQLEIIRTWRIGSGLSANY